MTVKLSHFQYSKRGATGWQTRNLSFGNVLTLALGPNGAGKTPLLKGIAYALGHAVELPPEIKANCESVILTLTGDGSTNIVIERFIGEGFACQVVAGKEEPRMFRDEKTFSEWLLEALDIPPRALEGKKGEVIPPYMSVLAPMFFIDQDLGWRNLYSPLPTHNFLRDQAEEVTRWLLSLSPRHKAVDKSAFVRAKTTYESLQEQLEIKRKTIAALRREMGQDGLQGGRERWVAARERALADLKAQSSILEVLAQSHSALDDRLSNAHRERSAAEYALKSGERHQGELQRIRHELETEVQILGTNETASEAFRSLCGNDNCQFFRRPDESYGRRMLYLKDQLKDFKTSFSRVNQDVEQLRHDFARKDEEYRNLLQAKQSSTVEAKQGSYVELIDRLSMGLSESNMRLQQFDRLEKEEQQLQVLINRALRAEEEIQEHRPTGGGRTDTRLTDVRSELSRSIRGWLETLRTQNLPSEISFDDNLRLHLGSERFSEASSSSGSTRTRIVLAFHAAMVETSIRLGGCHPHFLILDAPKQHELHAEDLAAFVRRLHEISSKWPVPVQLIIGATDEDFVDERAADAVWRPEFNRDIKPRFFGPDASVLSNA